MGGSKCVCGINGANGAAVEEGAEGRVLCIAYVGVGADDQGGEVRAQGDPSCLLGGYRTRPYGSAPCDGTASRQSRT